MSVFVERTVFEAGFAAQWDSHLAPVIAAVRRRLARFAALLHLASAVPQRGADAPLPQRDAHRKQALA